MHEGGCNMYQLTRNNIARDLNISPHKKMVRYSNAVVVYVFSSEFYKEKFKRECVEHREKINNSLSNRFGFSIRAELVADLKLYSAIEKRGFLIYYNEDKVECLSDITLDGLMLTPKN